MMKPDVLFDLFYKDRPLPERIERIAAAGWRHIETWKGGDAAEIREIGRVGRENGVELVSIVMNFNSETAVAPVRVKSRAAFLERIDRYADHALAAGCSAGIVTSGDRVGGLDYYSQKQSLIDALTQAAGIAARKGFQLNLEPLNDKVDHPGYFLTSREEALDVVRRVHAPNVRMLYDLYHQQIMTGDHLAFLLANLEWIGHFHAAGVPGRHEIVSGELNYPTVIRRLRDAGYDGTFGLEYMPAMEDGASLRASWECVQAGLA